jgi:hypothetical protein
MQGEDAEGRRKELIFFLSPNTTLIKIKGEIIPAQGSKSLRFTDFKKTGTCGKVVTNEHLPPLRQEIILVLISVRG